MTIPLKYALGAVVVAVLLATAVVMVFDKPEQLAAASPAGTTSNTSRFASIAVNLAAPGANATSSSILNTDANDRYISTLKVGCEVVGTSQTAYTGAGLATLTVFAATTSTAAPATVSNTNKVGGGNVTIATSTVQFGISTSTIGAATGNSQIYMIWPAGSYLTFTANATNTALCTFGADYFQS